VIENPEMLADCDRRIVSLIDYMEALAKQKKTSIVLTSRKRSGTGGSWHNKGLAIDFYFKDINVFKLCTELYYLCEGQNGVFKGVTEFEMVRDYVNGKAVNHFHIAFGNEPHLETFTSNYKGILY